MEPLSYLLALLKPQTSVSAGLDAGGAWALQFPKLVGIKFMAVAQGGCWLKSHGDENEYRLEQGDCVLLTEGRSFVLASDLSLPTPESKTAYLNGCDSVGVCNGGGDFFVVGAHFFFSSGPATPLLESLPAVVVVGKESDQASVLRWSLDRFERELREKNPGGSLVAEHLAHIMLIQVLRLHLNSARSTSVGLLFAHTDPQLGAAVAAVHGDIARAWSLEELSKIAGMSRSSFASRFKKVTAITPMEYLTCWRLHIAADRLRNTSHNIALVANSVGYESEAAFSRAFKKVLGQSPKLHRRSLREGVMTLPAGR